MAAMPLGGWYWNRVVGKAEGKQWTSLLLQKFIHAKPVKMVANILSSWGKGYCRALVVLALGLKELVCTTYEK